MRYVLCILGSVVACFGMQAFFYYGLGGKTGKGESNYFSTMGRFQAAAQSSAEIAFVGSSITGRIPGREIGNQHIANLGSDGGPALDGIRLIASQRIPYPKWLIIEANTLYGLVGLSDTLVVKGASAPWFKVGAELPLLGASARPSAMLYSALLRRDKVLQAQPYLVQTSSTDFQMQRDLGKLSAGEEERLSAYREAISNLMQNGVRPILVKIPAGEMTEREAWLMELTVKTFANEMGIPFVDLSAQIPRNELLFTDSVHLGAESAARVMSTMQNFCETN